MSENEENGTNENGTSSEPRKKRRPSNAIRMLSKSERLRNYAGAIAILLGAVPALGSLIVSTMTAYRGEPAAEKALKTVNAAYSAIREEVNKQRVTLEAILERQNRQEGREEALGIATLQMKLDKANDHIVGLKQLLSEKKKEEPVVLKVSTVEKRSCPLGHIWSGSKCDRVSRAVAKKVKEDQKKTEAVKKELSEEKEHKRKLIKILQISERKWKSKLPNLKKLPKNIEDSPKYEKEKK